MNVKYIKRDAEMDRIADAFSGYIHRHSNLDLVWSEKIGYVLMTINPDKRLGEEYWCCGRCDSERQQNGGHLQKCSETSRPNLSDFCHHIWLYRIRWRKSPNVRREQQKQIIF